MTETCAGTLVVHATPDSECTEPHCPECQELSHSLVIPCADVDGDCPLCAAELSENAAA
ncbi:MAG TPA: hypothetical protein VGR06_34830 [Actinophytocola sp.]|jgi:hypothetical protein|uniref:hypothetical protein n=1 Tax=Actinophytocola sp. TaxID=1872138 RepID=UPI002E0B35AC|nr:hypothetical protein [Actinophytocola sp.]